MTTSSIPSSPLNITSCVLITVPLGKEGIPNSAIDVWLSWRGIKMVQRGRKNDTHRCGLLPIYEPLYRQLLVSYPLPARRLHRVIRPFRMLEYRSGLCCRVMGVMEAKDWPGSTKLDRIQIYVRR